MNGGGTLPHHSGNNAIIGDDEDISLFDGMVVAGVQVVLDDVSLIIWFIIVGNAYKMEGWSVVVVLHSEMMRIYHYSMGWWWQVFK